MKRWFIVLVLLLSSSVFGVTWEGETFGGAKPTVKIKNTKNVRRAVCLAETLMAYVLRCFKLQADSLGGDSIYTVDSLVYGPGDTLFVFEGANVTKVVIDRVTYADSSDTSKFAWNTDSAGGVHHSHYLVDNRVDTFLTLRGDTIYVISTWTDTLAPKTLARIYLKGGLQYIKLDAPPSDTFIFFLWDTLQGHPAPFAPITIEGTYAFDGTTSVMVVRCSTRYGASGDDHGLVTIECGGDGPALSVKDYNGYYSEVGIKSKGHTSYNFLSQSATIYGFAAAGDKIGFACEPGNPIHQYGFYGDVPWFAGQDNNAAVFIDVNQGPFNTQRRTGIGLHIRNQGAHYDTTIVGRLMKPSILITSDSARTYNLLTMSVDSTDTTFWLKQSGDAFLKGILLGRNTWADTMVDLGLTLGLGVKLEDTQAGDIHGIKDTVLNKGTGGAYGGLFQGASTGGSATYGVKGLGVCSGVGTTFGGDFYAPAGGTGIKYGLNAIGYSNSAAKAYGVRGWGINSSSGDVYGGFFQASDTGAGTGICTGVYATSCSIGVWCVTTAPSKRWAIYASGNVFVTDTTFTSHLSGISNYKDFHGEQGISCYDTIVDMGDSCDVTSYVDWATNLDIIEFKPLEDSADQKVHGYSAIQYFQFGAEFKSWDSLWVVYKALSPCSLRITIIEDDSTIMYDGDWITNATWDTVRIPDDSLSSLTNGEFGIARFSAMSVKKDSTLFLGFRRPFWSR